MRKETSLKVLIAITDAYNYYRNQIFQVKYLFSKFLSKSSSFSPHVKFPKLKQKTRKMADSRWWSGEIHNTAAQGNKKKNNLK